MDLLEKVKPFIEDENYNALEAIYNAKLAKLGRCAVVSKKILLAEDLSASSDIPKNDACLRVMSDKIVLPARYISTHHFQYEIMLPCSLNVPETNLKSFTESRLLSGLYFILLGNDPENSNSPCSKHIFVLSIQLHRICEIRHAILLVTVYMSYKLGEGLVLDFGGPSDSYYCFYVGSSLPLLLEH